MDRSEEGSNGWTEKQMSEPKKRTLLCQTMPQSSSCAWTVAKRTHTYTHIVRLTLR